MEWLTQKSRPAELFGFRVAEVSDGMMTSYTRIGRIRSIDRIVNSYMSGYALDGNDYEEVREGLTIIIHPRFTKTSEGDTV